MGIFRFDQSCNWNLIVVEATKMKQKRRPNSICSCIYLGQLTGRYNMCKIKTSKLTGARVHLSVCLYDDNSSTEVKHLAYSVEGILILSLLSKTITIVC